MSYMFRNTAYIQAVHQNRLLVLFDFHASYLHDKQQPTQQLNSRLEIYIKYTNTDAAYKHRNGINQFCSQKCFTYFLMQCDLQSFCKWAAVPCNGFCSSWEAGVSEKLLIEGEM